MLPVSQKHERRDCCGRLPAFLTYTLPILSESGAAGGNREWDSKHLRKDVNIPASDAQTFADFTSSASGWERRGELGIYWGVDWGEITKREPNWELATLRMWYRYNHFTKYLQPTQAKNMKCLFSWDWGRGDMSHCASTWIIKVLHFFTVILTIMLIFIVPKACLVVSNTFSRIFVKELEGKQSGFESWTGGLGLG